VATRLLEKLGATVEVVGNGLEAVENSSLRKYDIILMDVSMPEMDGLEATRIIKQSEGMNATTPIIALTAYALDEDRQRVIAAGVDAFMSKPVDRAELARVLSRFVFKQPHDGSDTDSANGPRDDMLLFDMEVVDSLFYDMDEDAGRALTGAFKTDIAKFVSQLDKGRSENNLPLLEAASHGLKSVAGTFGASELFRRAAQLNNHCRTKKTSPRVAEIEQIIGLAGKVIVSADDLESRYLDLLNNKQTGEIT